MVRPGLAALAALLVLAVAAPAAGAAGLETVVQDDRLLLHQPAETVAQSMAQIRALGAERVRLTANWSSLAPNADVREPPTGFDGADPAAYEQARWRGLDTAVRAASDAGLHVVIDVGFWAPVWATSDAAGPRARSNVDPKAFADFAVAVAKRYSGAFVAPPDTAPSPPPAQDDSELEQLLGIGGAEDPPPPAPPVPQTTPLPAVDQLILWNEPNHNALLLPQWRTEHGKPVAASPAIYRRMVQAAYPAVKAVRPDVTVLIGNTSSTGGSRVGDGPVAPLAFLRGVACVDRRLRPVTTGDCKDFTPVPGDGWAHHPYTRNQPPDTRSRGKRSDDVLIGDLGRLSRVLRQLASAGRITRGVQRIHVTEFGYETGYIEGRPTLTPAQQAVWLPWAEREADAVPNVVGWAQFLLRDQPPAAVRVSDSSRRPFGQFFTGLLDADGRPKPAADAFRSGLVVQRAGRRTLTVWGRLRLGPGAQTVTLQRSVRGRPWRTLATRAASGRPAEASFTADGQSTFGRVAAFTRHARYRLALPGTASPPVPALPRRCAARC